jgi:hypothetical protein
VLILTHIRGVSTTANEPHKMGDFRGLFLQPVSEIYLKKGGEAKESKIWQYK